MENDVNKILQSIINGKNKKLLKLLGIEENYFEEFFLE